MVVLARSNSTKQRSLAGSCLVALLVLCAGPASAQSFEFQPTRSVSMTLVPQSTHVPKAEALPTKFGDPGTVRIQVGASGAYDFDDVTLVLSRVSVSLFIFEGLSLDLEGDLGYIGQSEGSDGIGGGVTLLTRWHFIRKETWSIYGDFGIGLFFSSVDVPVGGGQVNFNPQAGLGVSFQMAKDVRMMLGLRWTHLSNARTLVSNPGVDALAAYAMVSFGF